MNSSTANQHTSKGKPLETLNLTKDIIYAVPTTYTYMNDLNNRDYFAIHASEEDIQEMLQYIKDVEVVSTKPSGSKFITKSKPKDYRQIARYLHADKMIFQRMIKHGNI